MLVLPKQVVSLQVSPTSDTYLPPVVEHLHIIPQSPSIGAVYSSYS